MKLKVIGTGSKGNCYLLTSSTGETLVVECGIKFTEVKKALDYQLSGVVGCILSHSHFDHSKHIKDYLSSGIDLYTSKGTLEALKLSDHYRSHSIRSGNAVQVGGFKVLPFDIIHDAPEPLGFLISHEEMGVCLFLTDTHYSEYTFKGLNHLILEINYCEEILDSKNTPQFLRDRIINSHLSLENALGMLDANDLSNVKNIVLIHLSDSNSNEAKFIEQVKSKTGIPTHAANAGKEYCLSLNPF